MRLLAGLSKFRSYWSLWLLASMIFLAGCGQGITFSGSSDTGVPDATFELPTAAPTAKPTLANTRVLPLDSLTPEPTPTITPIPDEVLGLVVQVIDGDTIAVVMEGDPPALAYEVRYIGVEAPPNNSTAPWGVVAYETNRKMTGLKVVRLVRDETELDDEGRLLRHVYVDNQLMSIILAEQGLAQTADSGENTEFAAEISEAETRAREAGLGLWSNTAPTATPPRDSADAEAEATEESSEPPSAAETEEPPTEADEDTATTEPDDASEELTPEPSETVESPSATDEATTPEAEATEETDGTPTRPATPSTTPTRTPTTEPTPE